ncbi:MAG: EboA domain-containing protein [Adhaeribacter sp.]
MPNAAIREYLLRILLPQLPATGTTWLQKQLANLKTEKDFYLAFSVAPRFTGKKHLNFTEAELQEAEKLRPGFNPANWTADQIARTLLVFAIPHESPEAYVATLDRLFSTADLNELATLYASLPLLPYPEHHVKRAAEGVRTTMTQVFDAIALNNPYPHDYLPQEAWNQLVLKSVFNVRPLYQIYGLDNRRNEALAQIAIDYAHERWAAGRTLTPELWRLVGPFLKPENLKDIQRLLQTAEEVQQLAAALALTESNLPEAKEILAQHPELTAKIQAENITWQTIGENAYTA